MDEVTRRYYVRRVAEICWNLAEWTNDAICGVDRQQLLEVYLSKGNSPDRLDGQQLLQNCRQMSMDISSFVFYHYDLGPGNILVDPVKRSIGTIDWELAGYVPREWVKTKFNLSAGMDFPTGEESGRSDWRRLVARQLAELGFTDAIDAWLEFRSDLPTEVLLQILKTCTDLSALYSFINTSTRLASVFDNHAAEIVETVLRSVVPGPVRRVMRMVVYIRTGGRFDDQRWEHEDIISMTPAAPLPTDGYISAGGFRARRWEDMIIGTAAAAAEEPPPPPALLLRKFLYLAHKIHVQFFFELKVGRLKGRLKSWSAQDLSALECASIVNFFQAWAREQAMAAVEFINDEIRAAAATARASDIIPHGRVVAGSSSGTVPGRPSSSSIWNLFLGADQDDRLGPLAADQEFWDFPEVESYFSEVERAAHARGGGAGHGR
ncbi:hypothetical protein B0H66DRAFT_530840 [Apodospora peruviana]|uniref:Aminoglycoside phosphotransferase domain-containing protein n=1 Tax=Apodospora peruviana TaxID=516989 RepID=A0AAE0MBZ5_9PEZI|nr:hypothetical protein B0H66DRAFT_530840 [Apodospora peruviana]